MKELTEIQKELGLAHCGYCSTALVETKPTECGKCETLYHPECWTENEGCGIYGCEQKNSLVSVVEKTPVENQGLLDRVKGAYEGLVESLTPSEETIDDIKCKTWVYGMKGGVAGSIGLIDLLVGNACVSYLAESIATGNPVVAGIALAGAAGTTLHAARTAQMVKDIPVVRIGANGEQIK